MSSPDSDSLADNMNRDEDSIEAMFHNLSTAIPPLSLLKDLRKITLLGQVILRVKLMGKVRRRKMELMSRVMTSNNFAGDNMINAGPIFIRIVATMRKIFTNYFESFDLQCKKLGDLMRKMEGDCTEEQKKKAEDIAQVIWPMAIGTTLHKYVSLDRVWSNATAEAKTHDFVRRLEMAEEFRRAMALCDSAVKKPSFCKDIRTWICENVLWKDDGRIEEDLSVHIVLGKSLEEWVENICTDPKLITLPADIVTTMTVVENIYMLRQYTAFLHKQHEMADKVMRSLKTIPHPGFLSRGELERVEARRTHRYTQDYGTSANWGPRRGLLPLQLTFGRNNEIIESDSVKEGHNSPWRDLRNQMLDGGSVLGPRMDSMKRELEETRSQLENGFGYNLALACVDIVAPNLDNVLSFDSVFKNAEQKIRYATAENCLLQYQHGNREDLDRLFPLAEGIQTGAVFGVNPFDILGAENSVE